MVTQESGKRPFCIKGMLKGKRVIALIDFGASHNFISKDLVVKRRLKSKKFKGFKVIMGNGTLDQCMEIIPQLEITLNNHTIEVDFFVVKLKNDIILGIPWIDSLGYLTIDNPNLEVCFKHEGEDIILKGLPNGSPRIVSCNRIECILRHNQGEWIAECFVLDKSPNTEHKICVDIYPILEKHQRIFE